MSWLSIVLLVELALLLLLRRLLRGQVLPSVVGDVCLLAMSALLNGYWAGAFWLVMLYAKRIVLLSQSRAVVYVSGLCWPCVGWAGHGLGFLFAASGCLCLARVLF